MKERTRNLAVGLTALGGLAGCIILLLLFGYIPEFLSPGYYVTVKAPNASGISVDANVYLEGIQIGKVREIKLEQLPASGVIITCKIDDKYRLPEGVTVDISRALLSGSASISVSRADVKWEENGTFLPTDGSAVIIAQETSPFGNIAGELKQTIQEPLKKFETVADHINALSDEWKLLGENLNKLAQHESLQSVDDGTAFGNLSTVLQRADARLAQVKQVLAGIDSYVNDPTIRSNIEGTVANAKDLTANANTTITDVKESVVQLRNRYIALADDMSKAVASMQKTLDEAREGKGTVGQLMSNPAFYNNITDASERLKSAMRELQILFEKWNTEGIELNL
ncbi:MlaD family protein [Poriferisphaera sp. WC338]|uniref:MlaD family protein n=1 Tax=Poriferisphaera sp. WC338 TaxID=3425129 RepID=UPI003D815542